MSDSSRLHGLQPTRLLHPWDFPGKSTGVGCHACAQSCPTLCNPMDCGSSKMGFPRQEYWSGLAFPSPGDLPDPGIEPRSPALREYSLPAEPQGKPKNTGVGSQSLLQWIFLTQESNWGLLHCWQILYQLNYQGSPSSHFTTLN